MKTLTLAEANELLDAADRFTLEARLAAHAVVLREIDGLTDHDALAEIGNALATLCEALERAGNNGFLG